MEVARSNYLPADPRLIDSIVYELKSQGIFDNFRKECISDVDTKPAYQNLRQRVEGSVMGFLKNQQWSPDMNKNQVREMLRKNISESGFLETGVERIVDQVVNPKINSIFFPQVENIVYKFLGIQKATDGYSNKTFVNTSNNVAVHINDLLPNDLEAVSPENEVLDRSLQEGIDVVVPIASTGNDLEKAVDIKIDDEESPPFEAIEETALFPPQEESSLDSHLSGISDLTNHDSNQSFGTAKAIEMDISNGEYPTSSDNVDSSTSVQQPQQTTEIKMDISEDSNYSKAVSDVTDSNSKTSFDNVFEQVSVREPNSNNTESVSSSDNYKYKKSDSKYHNLDKHNDKSTKCSSSSSGNERHASNDEQISSDKHTTNDKTEINDQHTHKNHKDEREKKLDNHRNDSKHKSRHSSKSSYDREKDAKSVSKRSDSKSDKERKSDKHHSSSRHSSSHRNSDKSSKSSEKSEQKNDKKPKELSESRSPSKKDSSDQTNNDKHRSRNDSENLSKHNKDKNRSDSSKKHSSDSKHSKDKNSHHSSNSKSSSESKSQHSSRDRSDSKNRSKHKQTKSDNGVKVSSHKHEDKHHSRSEKRSSSSGKKDKRDKDRKESKKDDHHNSKEKKYHRRSTDRDSSDGRSGTHSSSGSFTESYSSTQAQKANADSSKINSGSNSGDSGSSDQTETITQPQVNENTVDNAVDNKFQHIKLIKPKFASNIFEARRLLKIRKQISKIEKQNQLKLANSTAILNNDNIKENVVECRNNINVENSTQEIYLNKNVIITRKTVNVNTNNKPENKEKTPTEIKPVQEVELPSPLTSSIISKESWDAIEAKLNSTNILNVDYNSYVDISDDVDDVELSFSSKVINAITDGEVSSSNDVKEKTEVTDSQTKEKTNNLHEAECSQTSDKILKVPKEATKDGDVNKNCLYLVPEVLPETLRYFDKIANRINLLEEEIARRTKLLILHTESQKNKKDENDINKRLPKVDIVDVVNTDSEIVISPSKSENCQIKNNQDVHNNNSKRKLQFDDVDEINENHTTKLDTSERYTPAKGKKFKLTHSSVGEVNFSLPLSPADSENSISSNSEKSKSGTRTSARRTSSRQQSYTSDDLYKPRLRFTSSRRRFGTNSPSDVKN